MSDPTSSDRLLDAVRRIIRAQFPRGAFVGTFEYTITATSGAGTSATVDCTPNASATTGLPALSKVPVRDASFGTHTPTVGNLCHIEFLNGGDPSSPVCTWCQPNASELAAARQTDAVQVTIPAGSFLVAASGGTLNPSPVNVSGTITGGSSRAKIE